MSNGETRSVLPVRSDVRAIAQRKNAKQAAEEEKKSISELSPAQQYGRIAENIGTGFQNLGNIGGEGEFLGGEGTRSIGEFFGNVGDQLRGTFGTDQSAGPITPQLRGAFRGFGRPQGTAGEAEVPDPIIDQLEVERFASQTQIQLEREHRRMTLFDQLYSEGLSPESRTMLDEAYVDVVAEVDELNAEITNRLAALQVGQELVGVDPTTGQVAVSDVDAAGMVPGIGGAQGRAGGTTTTPEQQALGGVFERATARALETQPNVQGTSGPFTFVRGGAESDAHRAMQEQQIADFIGETDKLVTQGAGGQNISSQADSLAQRAAELEMDALGISDRRARRQMGLVFEQTIRQDIDNLVQQRQDIVNEFEGIEAALAEEDLAQGAQRFALGFDPTPDGAFLDAFETGIDTYLSNVGFQESAPGQFDEIVEVATTIGALDDNTVRLLESGALTGREGEMTGAEAEALAEGIDPAQTQAALAIEQGINLVASKYDLDPTALKNEAIRSRAKASRVYQDIQNLGSTRRVESGSHAAAYLIYQEAAPRLGEEAAQALANSPAMHKILDVASGGRVGLEKGGDLAGLGGLSKEVYKRGLNLDYETIRGDAFAEMGALLDYMMVAYGGDPVAALTAMRDEKTWGRLPGENVGSVSGDYNEWAQGER